MGHVSRAHLSQKTCFQKLEKNRRKLQSFQKLTLRYPSGYDLRKHIYNSFHNLVTHSSAHCAKTTDSIFTIF